MKLILVVVIASVKSLPALVAYEQLHTEVSPLMVFLVTFGCESLIAESTLEILGTLMEFHMTDKAASVSKLLTA